MEKKMCRTGPMLAWPVSWHVLVGHVSESVVGREGKKAQVIYFVQISWI
jgi:hypothetical protein